MSNRNKMIPDESITSSSSLSINHTPSYARLDGPRAWCSAPGDNSSYIQILLVEKTLITAIETQGSRYDSSWSRRYDVWYLKRGKWILHNEGLPGNSNANSARRNELNLPIRTRSVRIYPQDPFVLHPASMPKVPCLRLELYGCTAPAPCVEPTDPRHGWKVNRDFRHGRSVRFYCFSGYQRVGVASITCKDGKWDGWVPLCKGVCGRPRTSSTVQLQGSRYLHGDEVTFSCPRNYDLFGKAKLRCVNRKWDSPIPECKARCTLVAGPPEHGFYVKGFINYKDDMIKHGERISYGCNATYALVGDSTQECNDGRWNNPRPSCKGLTHETTNWGHHFNVSYGFYGRRDRHLTWSSEPCQGLAICGAKGVPLFLRNSIAALVQSMPPVDWTSLQWNAARGDHSV
ncbi:unnamed protein product, partial [Porites evermanni]